MNILKRGINSNMLKTIALIAMVIDCIGFYFSANMSPVLYTVCRYVGRMAMPLFIYLLAQGFFHTKNFKKYITRIGILAVITQILITLLMFVNMQYIPEYTAAKQVYTNGNILFAFTISLALLKILHQDVLIKKWDYNKNLSLKIVLAVAIVITSILLPIDYGEEAVILSGLLYYIEKFKIKIYIEKSCKTISIGNIFLNSISESKIKRIYLGLIFMVLSILLIYFNSYWTVLLAIIPISLYNGERCRKGIQYVYYVTFVLQHVLLYLIAMAYNYMTLT